MGTRELLYRVPVGKHRIDLSSTNITTSAWTSIITALAAACDAISVEYNGDAIVKLSKNGGTSELPIYLTPGMNQEHPIPINLAKGVQIHAKAEDQNATEGELIINLYG